MTHEHRQRRGSKFYLGFYWNWQRSERFERLVGRILAAGEQETKQPGLDSCEAELDPTLQTDSYGCKRTDKEMMQVWMIITRQQEGPLPELPPTIKRREEARWRAFNKMRLLKQGGPRSCRVSRFPSNTPDSDQCIISRLVQKRSISSESGVLKQGNICFKASSLEYVLHMMCDGCIIQPSFCCCSLLQVNTSVRCVLQAASSLLQVMSITVTSFKMFCWDRFLVRSRMTEKTRRHKLEKWDLPPPTDTQKAHLITRFATHLPAPASVHPLETWKLKEVSIPSLHRETRGSRGRRGVLGDQTQDTAVHPLLTGFLWHLKGEL